MRNLARAKSILDQMWSAGVRVIAVCAGARNAPLLEVLHRSSGFEVLGFFEERSAAFFCLGRGKRDGEPTAVITTSGTAAAELLPAVIEAHYGGVPLVVVTADRPRCYRGTGAPQAIEQPGLFGPYVERAVDLEDDADLDLDRWSRSGPIHVNACFDEPLLDGPIPKTDCAGEVGARPASASRSASVETREAIRTFLGRTSRPAAIVGEVPSRLRGEVLAQLLALRLPIYLEAPSGLREEPRLRDLRLRGGERFVGEACRRGWMDGILRLGGVPTLRVWRDLDGDLSGLPVLSLSHRPFAGLSRERPGHVLVPLAGVVDGLVPVDAPDALLERDRRCAEALAARCRDFPRSEVALVRALSARIPPTSFVYLGNSQPIRQWDLAAEPPAGEIAYGANRGANGIDGQLSTFMGMCRPDRPNLALVGDLTALHDPASLWGSRHLPAGTDFTIIVINNGGGGIFEAVFGHDRFRNPHEIRFRGWAEQWGLAYHEWTEVPDRPFWNGRAIVEMRPDAEQTRSWRRAAEDPWHDLSD